MDEVVIQEERRTFVGVPHDECVIGWAEVVEVCEQFVVRGVVSGFGGNRGNVLIVKSVTGNGLVPFCGFSDGTEKPQGTSWVRSDRVDQ